MQKNNYFFLFLKISFFIFLLFILIFSVYLPNYFYARDLKLANKNLKEKIKQLEKKIGEMEVEKNNRDYYLEKTVRENFGMKRKDEIIIDIER